MKCIKHLFFFAIMLVMPSIAFAGDHPEANFGIYGINHFSTVKEYQQNYEGQVVKYLPMRKGGGYMDEEYFLKKGGKFDTEYIISKISGNDKRMTFVLTEKNGKGKVKMIVNNQDEYYSFDKYCYCITNWYSIPLFLSEKFEADKSQYVGKVYPESSDSPIKYEVVDLTTQFQENPSYKDHKYPTISFVLKDKNSSETFLYDMNNVKDLNVLGKTFSNPRFKCQYTVVGVHKKAAKYTSEIKKYYVVKNSLDGKTKEVEALSASTASFDGDDSGHFFSTLTKVEKPSNAAVRYGKTTSVTDKNITKYSYIDNFIDILIFTTNSQFNFVLKNVSDNTIKVVWNEAVFVDVDGSTSKVMHSGIKYSQREGDQPASTIIKGAKLEDLAAPTANVYYSDVLKEWTSYSLYRNADRKAEGQTIRLMLPIQVKDVINEYIFEFGLTYVYDHPEYLAD